MAQISFIGRLGKDVEVKTVGTSTVAKMNVAESVGYGDNKSTNWFGCDLWGKQAETGLIQHLVKGKEVYISGEFKTREHNGKNYNEVRINEIRLIGGGQQQQPQQGGYQQQQQPKDNLPF